MVAALGLTVQAGRIEAVEVRRHFHGPGHGAEQIVDRVLAAQSLEVDEVTGATYSSRVSLLAIREALEKER